MGYRSLLRFKGLVLATGLLLVLILLYALVSASIEGRESRFGESVRAFTDFQTRLTSSTMSLSAPQKREHWRLYKASDKGVLTGLYSSEFAKLEQALQQNDDASITSSLAGIAQQARNELSKKGKLATYIDAAAMIMFVLFYALAVLPQIARISQEEAVEGEARKEAENILGTVSEGLFLLGRDHEIGVEQSASLKGLFRSELDLEGNFFDFISQYVPESTVTIARDYLELLYGERVKEKLVQDLNPLNEVEIHIARRDGSYESRYLNFNFNRVLVDGELSHILGSVTDVTKEVLLARELEDTKEEQEAQLDLLMSVLHLDQPSLLKFFERADKTLKEINETLEKRGYSDLEIREKTKKIAENAHRVKGDAAAMGLHSFEFSLHELETELQKVKDTKDRLTGRDLLPAVTRLKDAFANLENMRRIVTRFSEALVAEQDLDKAVLNGSGNSDNNTAPVSDKSSIEAQLHSLAGQLSERQGFRVLLKTFGLGEDEVPENLKEMVSSSAIQLIRNSVVHGGRPPAERLKNNKPDYMTIVVSLTPTDKGLSLVVRDDGEGLDEERILNRAVELGLLTEQTAAHAPEGLAKKLIFHSGFSSKSEADLDAGRGVGLNTVYSMVRESGGSVAFRHQPGSYCQFHLMFNPDQQAGAV